MFLKYQDQKILDLLIVIFYLKKIKTFELVKDHVTVSKYPKEAIDL